MEKIFKPLNYLLAIVIVVGLIACENKVTSPTYQNLDSWEFQHQNKWLSAEVPGNNYSDLIRHEEIPNPFWGANEELVQWVKDSTWTYRCEFIPQAQILSHKKQELHFEGLDTYADVYLNDSLILSANNQFRTWNIEVDGLLMQGKNQVQVVFHPVESFENERQAELDYELPGGTRVFTRKAAFNYGWDWSPKILSSGIWRPVKLQAWSGIKMTDVYIEQVQISDKEAELIAHISYTCDTDGEYTFAIANERKAVKLEHGNGTVKIPLSINQPELWWPIGHGNQKIYEFTAEILDNDKTIASLKTKTGLRTIELTTEKDSLGESFQFRVNGRDIFMKGANYVPQDNLQNRVSKNKYEKLLQSTVDANMNMLRVWGGGIYDEDIFYELCDSLGVLVWQDFMFACAMYPGDPSFLENVEQEANENVKRLRNYACIALWCGNNENSEGWHRWGWQDPLTELQQEEVWTAYKNVFNDILPKSVGENCNTPYWESSPMLGRGDPKHQFSGDAHYWGVWHDAEPFEVLKQKVPRFMSEFGFLSFPSVETLDSISFKEDQNLSSESLKNHVKHTRGLSLINQYLERDYSIPEDFEKFVYVNQVMQAEGIALGLKAHRRAKGYCMGTLYWQLNDCWPSASWSSIDYYGRWKAMHYLAKRAYSPILISSEMTISGDINIYVVSDINMSLQDTLESVLLNMKGDTLWQTKQPSTLEANEAKLINQIPLAITSTHDLTKTVLVNRLKTEGSREVFFFKSSKELALQKPELDYEVSKNGDEYVLSIQSDVVTRSVFLHGVDTHLSDNYFDLLPGEIKEIKIESEDFKKEDLKFWSLNNIVKEY